MTAIIDDVSVTIEQTKREFDVAVVSGSLPLGVTADVVLRLPDDQDPMSRLQVGDAERRFPFTDVPSLLDLVHRFCAHPVPSGW